MFYLHPFLLLLASKSIKESLHSLFEQLNPKTKIMQYHRFPFFSYFCISLVAMPSVLLMTFQRNSNTLLSAVANFPDRDLSSFPIMYPPRNREVQSSLLSTSCSEDTPPNTGSVTATVNQTQLYILGMSYSASY